MADNAPQDGANLQFKLMIAVCIGRCRAIFSDMCMGGCRAPCSAACIALCAVCCIEVARFRFIARTHARCEMGGPFSEGVRRPARVAGRELTRNGARVVGGTLDNHHHGGFGLTRYLQGQSRVNVDAQRRHRICERVATVTAAATSPGEPGTAVSAHPQQ